MSDSGSIPWRHRIGTKILLPSFALFVVFAAMVIIGFTHVFTERAEAEVVRDLEIAGDLFDRFLEETEERTALHARFMSDMVQLSEESSDSGTGRSVLVYLLEYLTQEGVETLIYPEIRPSGEPNERLVRRGFLGIRASSMESVPAADGTALNIASVSPIERAGGIQEVIVTSYRLDRARMDELAEKTGSNISLVRDGSVIVSTLNDPDCVRILDEGVTGEAEAAVLEDGRSLILDLACVEEPQRAIVRPVEVGFQREAVAVLSISLADIVAAKSRIRRDTVLGAGAVLVVIVLVYSFIVGRITRPIRDLSRITRTVDVDDLGSTIQVDSRDEVGELGASYNSMIQRLQDNRRELERLHREELDRADRLATIGEMAAGIAHEVRNPLAGISGAIQVLVRVDDLGSEKREILEETLNQIDRLDKLVGDLLAYSRPSAPRLEPADLNEVLEKSIFVLNLGGGKSEVRIEQHLDPGIPDVRVDHEQIQQVFLNLLLNAIQAIPGDGVVRVETTTESGEVPETVVVRIRDNGVGMSPETMEKALQPFFTTKSRGTGLGLSIARQILENHGARLRVSSVQGEGTEFAIAFPVGSG